MPDDKKSSTGTAKPDAPNHPGMMGDGTEEQNLNQPGNPGARITEAEVDEAFKDKASDKKAR